MKFGNLNDWHTDPEKCTQGVPLNLGEGRTLLVRRGGTRNRDFMAAVAGVDPADEVATQQVYARTVVAGWSGILDDKAEPIPFSPEACLELFHYAPEIFDAVWLFAAQRGNFRDGEIAADKSAVKTRSGGSRAQARTRSN
jgi:hypothetical protein